MLTSSTDSTAEPTSTDKGKKKKKETTSHALTESGKAATKSPALAHQKQKKIDYFKMTKEERKTLKKEALDWIEGKRESEKFGIDSSPHSMLWNYLNDTKGVNIGFAMLSEWPFGKRNPGDDCESDCEYEDLEENEQVEEEK